MNKRIRTGLVSVMTTGQLVVHDIDNAEDITVLFRPVMIDAAFHNNQMLSYDYTSERARRIPITDDSGNKIQYTQPQPVVQEQREMDPILELIKNSYKIKPAELEMSDIKWKYLVRSAVRGKNILCVGPAGCGKTQAAKALVNVPVTKELEVTEKEYQDLLKDPNVISVIKL